MTEQVTTSRRLVYNTFFNVAMLVSNAVVAFLLIRFFVGRLGEERYGVWVLIGSIFRYRMILSMGLNSAIDRRIPMYLAKDDRQGIQRIVSTALVFYSCVAAVLVVLSLLLCARVGEWFAIPPELVRVASVLVLVVGLGFAASTPLQLSTAVLGGLQRYDLIGWVTLVLLVLRTTTLVVLLLRGYGLLTLGLIYGLSEVVARGTQFLFTRRLLPHLAISWRSVDRTLLREMLFYGMNTFLYAIGALIVYRASETIIGIFLGTREVARFSIAAAGSLLLSQFVQAFTAAIKPAVSDLDARDDQVRVKMVAFLTQKYSLLVILPAAVFLAVMGKEFLTVWMAEKLPDPTVIRSMATVLAILTAGHAVMLAQHSNFLVLAGRGEHKAFGLLTAVEAVLCVVGAILAVSVLGWGLVGVAWSNFVPVAMVAGVILPIYFHRKMRISGWESLRYIWWPALRGTLPGIILIIVWKFAAPPDSWWDLFAVVIVTAAATLVAAWFLSMEVSERQRFRFVLGRHGGDPVAESGDFSP